MTLVLAGCGAPFTASPSAAAPTHDAGAITVGVAAADFVAGTPRIPFVLFQNDKPLVAVKSIQVAVFDLSASAQTSTWTGAAVSYADYEIPYWVAYPQVPHGGPWGVGLLITLADGGQTKGQFTVEVAPQAASPDVGESPPASRNRTLLTEPDISKLTSDPEPEPALYQLTVADALQSGRPTVITFATPAFCVSEICGPVVNTVKSVYHEIKSSVNFIHIEVYKSFDPLVYADEMIEWNLDGEPWTFVLDKMGVVAARLGGPVSPRELKEALALLVSP